MLVEAPHRRVAKEDAAAAVGLQAVLVGIDHDGVGPIDNRVGPARRLVERLGNQPEIAAVGRVHMHAEVVFPLERQNLVQRIHGGQGRGAQG